MARKRHPASSGWPKPNFTGPPVGGRSLVEMLDGEKKCCWQDHLEVPHPSRISFWGFPYSRNEDVHDQIHARGKAYVCGGGGHGNGY